MVHLYMNGVTQRRNVEAQRRGVTHKRDVGSDMTRFKPLKASRSSLSSSTSPRFFIISRNSSNSIVSLPAHTVHVLPRRLEMSIFVVAFVEK